MTASGTPESATATATTLDVERGIEISLSVPADVIFVPFIRQIVSAAAELEPALDEDRIADLALVVTEAATNAVEAHIEAGLTHHIRIWCQAKDNAVTLVIHDQGPGFDPDSLPALPPPESPDRLLHESGLGVTLMRMLADESEFQSGPDGTEVRLILHASANRDKADS